MVRCFIKSDRGAFDKSEDIVATFFKITSRTQLLVDKYGRDICGVSSMYHRSHVHFQLIFETFYLGEPPEVVCFVARFGMENDQT